MPPGAGDGKCTTHWKSYYKQKTHWILADLGSAKKMHGVTTVPLLSVTPYPVTHLLEVSTDGKTFTMVTKWDGTIKAGQIYLFSFSSPVTTRYLRIRTTKGPPWVGFTELAPFTCY